ncbi:hypothetical protein [Hymenobacter psoromatis]|uniref:hypothetical protein n=1 Tax=Hymenobacter psoromatis TaxID=1484116 RepID=UPI001CBF2468|nr:hypothetical protein [Hymenobacter psoromatis]
MKQDIPFDPVEGVSIAVVPDEAVTLGTADMSVWTVYLLNNNDFGLTNVLISAEGYGTQPAGEAVRTSTLRYHFEAVAPHSATQVELIDPAVFHLTNQYWVSYYQQDRIFDKKFIFVPDSIVPANCRPLALLAGRPGVLHG